MVIRKPVSELLEGDLVNLEDDPYADPRGDESTYEFELAEVVSVEYETDTCVLVGFEGTGACGFPPEHEVAVHGHVNLEIGGVTRWD